MQQAVLDVQIGAPMLIVEEQRPVPLIHKLWIPGRGPRSLPEVKQYFIEMGKVRDRHEVPADADEEAVKEIAFASEKLAPWIAGKEIVKAVYVPGKLLSLVVK